jgi:hypothetical protein
MCVPKRFGPFLALTVCASTGCGVEPHQDGKWIGTLAHTEVNDGRGSTRSVASIIIQRGPRLPYEVADRLANERTALLVRRDHQVMRDQEVPAGKRAEVRGRLVAVTPLLGPHAVSKGNAGEPPGSELAIIMRGLPKVRD